MLIMEKRIDTQRDIETRDANPDPITGAPGAHPVGVGVGTAAGGLAAGAAAGAVAGPVGAAVGAVVGGIAGGLAGKGIAESIDPTAEEAYWRENYTSRPYYQKDTTFDDYSPAYRYGVDQRIRAGNRRWDEAETEMSTGWHTAKGKSRLGWDKAKLAARDAWDRVERALPGDADGDGR
jgi:hypothetical protein